MSQTKEEAIFKVKDLRREAARAETKELKRHFNSMANLAEANLIRMTKNDSDLKPLRTPWKRLQGPKYFEET